jgi:His/Glu/Gln/Arg/opine family amino acid ABC transporter permease subunit
VKRYAAFVLALIAACLIAFACLADRAPSARAQEAAGSERALRVGLTGKYPPFNYFDDAGALTGFDVDVAREICAKIERPCAFQILQWDGILAALMAGKIDVVIGSMAVTEERSRQVSFSAPYYESGAQLFVRPGSAPPDAGGLTIGVTLGTTYESYVKGAFPAAEVRTYKGDTEIFQDVLAGRLDAVVSDKLVGAYLNRRYHAGLDLRGDPLYVERIAIPVRPERRELLAEINGAVNALRASPRYAALMDHYFGLRLDGGERAEAGTGPSASFQWGVALALMFRALISTIAVSFAGIALGGALAVLLSFGLIGLPRWPRTALLGYVDFVRATPFMIQLFAIYFGLPAVGVQMSAWTSAVLAIGLHSSAYLAEIVKTAYLSVPIGQHQAAATLGLSRREALLHVIWPQMLPLMTAPVLNTVVAMIKDSAIVSVISVHELTMQSQQLISTSFRPLELYLAAAVLYAMVTYPLLVLGRIQERRFKARGLLHDVG